MASTQAGCDRAAWYILGGQYEAALQQLEGVKTTGDSNAENENLRGLALMLKGDPQKALEAFDRAIALDGSLIEVRFNRAVALLKVGETASAAAQFSEIAAIKESRLAASAAYHHALALDRLGRAPEAEGWFERALALDPKFDAALIYLGILRERRADYNAAARAYLDYLRAKPDSIAAMLRLGVVASRAGRVDVARPYLKRVVERAPESNEAVEARKLLILWD